MREPAAKGPSWKIRVLVYGGLILALIFGATYFVDLMLYPGSTEAVPEQASHPAFSTHILGSDGHEINMWFASGQDDAPIVVFFNGNAQNLQDLHLNGFMDMVTKGGLGLLIMDYPGYGRSAGKPSEASILAGSRQAMDWLLTHHGERRKILMGWSLGAAVAAQMAREYEGSYDALVLASPWTSLKDVAEVHYPAWLVKLLVAESYDTLAALEGLKVPNIVVHGQKDSIIPTEQGASVARQLADGKPNFWVEIAMAEHNDIFYSKDFWKTFEQLLIMTGLRPQ